MEIKEEWRDILGYEGLYQISNIGRVKALSKKTRKKEKIKAFGKTHGPNGYNNVSLYKDNQIENLEWCTKSQNELHANRIGLKRGCGYGEIHHMTPFKNEDILEIRRSYANDNISMNKIAKKYNVSHQAIRNIVRRNTWKHLN